MGEDVTQDIPLSDMEKIGERKSEERICLFKDMVRRNLF